MDDHIVQLKEILSPGDLTARKIVPALFNLFLNDGLPDPFLVVGCARTKLSNQEFIDKMGNALKTANILDDQKWQDFSKSLYYRAIDYGELSFFKALAGSLRPFPTGDLKIT